MSDAMHRCAIKARHRHEATFCAHGWTVLWPHSVKECASQPDYAFEACRFAITGLRAAVQPHGMRRRRRGPSAAGTESCSS